MTIALDCKKLLGFRVAVRAENLAVGQNIGAKIGAKPVHGPKVVASEPSATDR